jgi:hypothetical protein
VGRRIFWPGKIRPILDDLPLGVDRIRVKALMTAFAWAAAARWDMWRALGTSREREIGRRL